jgi:predicted metal-dependent enzyme (double-stranded beta helix superfamily)
MTALRTATDIAQLAGFARTLARESGWQQQVRFDPVGRVFVPLADTGEYEAWLLTWLPGQCTGLHGHDGSAGAFVVTQGCLREVAAHARPDGPVWQTERTVCHGGVRAFGPRHVHEVANVGQEPAVSLHVYAPRLRTMTRYETGEHGLVAVSVEHAGVDW